MREALSGLTVRGRTFLAAGITAIVCGILLDQSTLSRIGMLLVALPLVTAVVAAWGRYRLALVRHIEPHLTEAGQPARVELTIANEGRIPTGTLLLEETVPYALGGRPRFVVDRIGFGWRHKLGYQIRSEIRGRFDIGPMRVTVADPFGLVELNRAFQSTIPFTVTPRVVTLPQTPLTGNATASGDSRPRAFLGGSAEDVTVREYRRGDELRRVHWRSSARLGQLMVRREEQPWQARATVFLDNRRSVHRGQGAGSSFEHAVVVAASVAVHLVEAGYSVRLVTSGGPTPTAAGVVGDLSSGWHDREGQADAAALLEALAVVETVSHHHIDASWMGEAGQGGVTVAVLGSIDDEDAGVLRRVRHHTGTALAFSLAVDGWSSVPLAPEQRRPSGVPLLIQHGWKAVELAPGDSVATRWRELGTRGAATGAGAGSRR
ncbi:uncharacterized protein (DUF58 family) [Nocardioides luteus]|uniref:Membrane protein n=1 Tax=Nocardioides luteus TaxID=1844 RepID=A0ABQ5SSI9_9ACTN|nr:DUF58 domain-containing protein [Nocardioides luteus]MDR7309989.1 uncharacterized protein (DUF58 family) [Nocardioides luteus]GGR59138.1 membrane protein [Nocardioides luteus]GLJ67102.1 membrane protein [Nocardioides luteus]